MIINEIQALWLEVVVLLLINVLSMRTFSSIKKNDKIEIVISILLIIIWIIKFTMLTYFAWFI